MRKPLQFVSALFDFNQEVILSANAEPGSNFIGWSGEGCYGTLECKVTMDQQRAVSASFEIDPASPQPLEVILDGNGHVWSYPAGIDCGNDCNTLFDYDSMVSLHALADNGYRFDGWVGQGECTGQEDCLLTMDGAKQVEASFAAADVPPCSGDTPVIDAHFFWAGTHFYCEAGISISVLNATIIENHSTVELSAPVLSFGPLFEVRAGGTLRVIPPTS